MKLQIQDNAHLHEFNLKSFNLFYSYNDEHQNLYETMQNAFNGKLSCNLNNTPYKKASYNILFFDEYLNANDSEKFKKNSIEYSSLENNCNLEVFDKHIVELRYNFEKLITTFFPQLTIKNKNIDCLDLITSIFGLEINHSSQFVVYRLLLLLDSIKQETKPTLILFKNTFNYCHEKVRLLLDFMNIEHSNIYYLYFTNNLQTLTNTKHVFLNTNTKWEYNNLQFTYKNAYIIKNHQTNLYNVNDYYHFHSDDELLSTKKMNITILSWFKYFASDKNLSELEQIFFYLIFNDNTIITTACKELLWVEEQ